MKTKQIEVCDANYFSVSCVHNDWADIKCGGSPILGYDFIVSPDEDVDEMKKFIELTIRKYKRPFMGISVNVHKDFPVDKLWTREKIEECIKKYEM